MTIKNELESMGGWAIEAQQAYSQNKPLYLKNLENIYNQARLRAYTKLRRVKGDISKAIIKKLASIEAAVKNLQKEKDVDENFASLIETIKESINLAEQLEEGRILESRKLESRTLENRTLRRRTLK